MEPIKKEKLSDIIFTQLVTMIRNQEYIEGEKLPSENDLAKYFNVSRVPVREAISKLVSVGYVESHQGKGSYIKSVAASDEFKEYTYGEFTKKELFNLLEMRTLLEVEAAKLSAQRRDEKNLKEIESALLDFKEITQDQFSIGHKADYNFHKAIVKSTNNDYIIQTFNNLQLVHQNALEFSLKLNIGKPRKREEVYKEHEEIYNAILTQDENEAKKRMEIHLINMRKKLGDERV
ncbi:FadR/GntR family transcriptional regulator [Salinicoccus kekensis]|uniref:GntR family transcriptional repressor for pyruvate dehydrogenase complex n=1 Tax=Salinicoccus kekensis TaxID=714307 RepID=A0A285U8N7_9STAP|nr:FadR/GntR family transcriptional regulator [Salinicoccus kekensis]SOC38202.1 GntR family transcriptional repressor for pyruvate dehydrogenase complex [Salinicoccus kekensis]